MNKSNGVAQCKPKNIIIPQSNPDPQLHGVCQEMITPQGEAKGLKDCLEEHGFDVSRMKAKCSPCCPFKCQNCCMARLVNVTGMGMGTILPTCVPGQGFIV
jgi:hypothetical protein